MKLGFLGLGRMGLPMTERLVRAGHEVVAYDLSAEAVKKVKAAGAIGAGSVTDLVQQLGDQPVIWMMIPHQAVDQQLHELLELLPAGSVIIDGGNSRFTETVRRAKQAAEHQVEYVDAGTSGGVLTAKEGYCLMVGGDSQAVQQLAPVFAALAQPDGWKRVGPSGAGHFVKMVHNGIEYGQMLAIAEGMQLLKEGPFDSLDLAEITELWQHGSIVEGRLNEVTHTALQRAPDMAGIPGTVARSGEGDWALEAAREHDVPMPALEAALKVRERSEQGDVNFATKVMAAQRNVFGAHDLGKN